MIIYKSPSATFTLFPDESYICLNWQPGAKFMLDDEVQTELSKLFEYIHEHKVRAIIVDETNFSLQDKFDLKGWFEFEFVPKLSQAGINRTAILVPKSRISEYQDEKVDSFMEPDFKFFSDRDSALGWIKES